METFSVWGAIRYGWETFKKRPWFLIGVTLLFAILNFIIPDAGERAPILTQAVLGIVSFVLGSALQLAGTSFALKAHDNVAEARLSDLWRPELFLKFLGATLLATIILGVAFLIPGAIVFGLYLVFGWAALLGIVLFVPSIILAIALSFVSYAVVDKNLGPVASIKESLRLTKGNRGNLFLFSLATVLVVLLGLICLVVGILVALPVVVLAMTHVYRILDAEKSSIVAA